MCSRLSTWSASAISRQTTRKCNRREPMRELSWTKHNKDKLEKVQAILEELKPYYPLTLRQIYYQMVGSGFIPNNVSQYAMLSQLLSQARYDGFIPWEVMEDRKRGFNCSLFGIQFNHVFKLIQEPRPKG